GFLIELAERCFPRVLAVVKSALRHLPPRACALSLGVRVGAPPGPDQTLPVEHCNADAWAVGQIVRRFGAHDRFIPERAVTGTIAMPCSEACLAKAAMRSIEARKAVAVPRAKPRSRAIAA